MNAILIDGTALKELDKVLGEFPKEAVKAKLSAMNRTLSQTNTEIQRQITSKYNLKRSDLNGGKRYKSERSNNLIRVTKPSINRLVAAIEVRGSTLTLSRFLQTPKAPVSHAGKTRKQISKIKPPTVKVKKGGKKPVITSKKAFVATGRGGVTGIFTRNDKGMVMLRTLSTAAMAGDRDILANVRKKAEEVFLKRTEAEINYRLEKLGRKLK